MQFQHNAVEIFDSGPIQNVGKVLQSSDIALERVYTLTMKTDLYYLVTSLVN